MFQLTFDEWTVRSIPSSYSAYHVLDKKKAYIINKSNFPKSIQHSNLEKAILYT